MFGSFEGELYCSLSDSAATFNCALDDSWSFEPDLKKAANFIGHGRNNCSTEVTGHPSTLSHQDRKQYSELLAFFARRFRSDICLKKQLELLQTTSTSFIEVQQKLVDKLDGDDEAKEQERLDDHHEEYGSKKNRLQGLLHLYEANEIADYIQEFIDQLKASGRDKAKTWGTTLQVLNEEIKRLTRLL